jgi:uncharacterized protein
LGSHVEHLLELMQDPLSYPHAVTRIQREETHISMVFLTGSFVYKIKKPLKLGFLDFSSLDQRKHYCLAEVALNSRLTHNVYQGIVPITLDDGRYRLDGWGPVVEYAVQMTQLPAPNTMKQLLRRGGMNKTALGHLARMLVVFYEKAATGGAVDAMGAPTVIEKNCMENFEETAVSVGNPLDAHTFGHARNATQAFFRLHSQWFINRIEAHKIRDGHGDLRAGHIYFCHDRIQIIDCIEFNERFRYVDVICDLAFLCMDLDFLGYREASRDFLIAYLNDSGDFDSFFLLAFYKCYRAMVRVKVNCLYLGQDHSSDFNKQEFVHETQRYLNLAGEYAHAFSRPMIWVVCGLIATGKSTLAQALAKALRVPSFNSDSVRKALAGDTGPVPFQEGNYARSITERTYDQLLRNARISIEQGQSVVLDATYGSRSHRDAIRQMALLSRARIVFVECTCREHLILERLRLRESAAAETSDARIEHFEPIKARYAPIEEIGSTEHIRINTEKSVKSNICLVLGTFA